MSIKQTCTVTWLSRVGIRTRSSASETERTEIQLKLDGHLPQGRWRVEGDADAGSHGSGEQCLCRFSDSKSKTDLWLWWPGCGRCIGWHCAVASPASFAAA